jgi:hypothetical protein
MERVNPTASDVWKHHISLVTPYELVKELWLSAKNVILGITVN